jgi:hypothetical protein|tara:strand:- start:4 stop:627 length:624 start_codon:yes stop_codon:yes gene_type:complete
MNFIDGEKLEKMKELIYHYKKLYEIGAELGFDNIMEKAKIKEVIMGVELGDTVFSKSTGEVKGADAINEKTGEVSEYKTTELKDLKELERFYASAFDNTNRTFSGSMTYNNGSIRKNVESYANISHKHGIFYRGDILSIGEINPEYVTSDDGLMKRVKKIENGAKYKSTNGNSVSVHYENGEIREGEGKIIYRNDIRTKSVLESFES